MSDVKVTIPRDDYNPNQRTNIDVEVVNPDGTVSTKTVKGAVQATTQEDGSVSFGILASAHVPFVTGGGASVVGTPVVTTGVSNTRVAPAYDSGVQGGDVICVIAWRSNSTATINTPTATGLTFTQAAIGTGASQMVAVYLADSPDTTARAVTTTWSGTSSATGVAVVVLRGVTSSAADTAGAWKNIASGVTVPSSSSAAADSLVIAVAMDQTYPSTAPITGPGAWDEMGAWTTTGWNAATAVSTTVTTGNTSGSAVFTNTASYYGAYVRLSLPLA